MLAAIGALGALCSAAQANDAAPAAPLPVARPADVGSTPAVARAGGAVEASGASATQSAGASTDGQAARQRIRALLRREAGFSGLPYDIADAVTAIESGYDPGVIGAVGEIGLMQVRPETAAMLGFQGDAAELARPEINVHYGVAYLAGAWRLAKGDVCRALMKYRAGHNQELMTPLSAAYCGRARTHLAALGSPFVAHITVPAIAAADPDPSLPKLPLPKRGAPPVRTEATSRAFWAAQEARIAVLRQRVEAKWRKMASR